MEVNESILVTAASQDMPILSTVSNQENEPIIVDASAAHYAPEVAEGHRCCDLDRRRKEYFYYMSSRKCRGDLKFIDSHCHLNRLLQQGQRFFQYTASKDYWPKSFEGDYF